MAFKFTIGGCKVIYSFSSKHFEKPAILELELAAHYV